MLNSQQPEYDESLRSQRLTEDEARAVIDLWQQEQVESGGLTTHPSVPDMAEGLNIGTDDVQRLLHQVRTRRADEELEQIRLAEEERQAAERDRREAEWRRQQAEQERRSALDTPWQSNKYAAPRQVASTTASYPSSSTILFWFIVIVLMLTLVPAMIISHARQNRYSAPVPAPGQTTCMTTDATGKEIPCSPDMERLLKEHINDR